MAKVYLIYFDINTNMPPGLNHGLASLAAVLRKKGHSVGFYHLVREDKPETVVDKVLKFSPDIVGFSFATNQRKHLDIYSRAISRRSKVLQVAGGIHSTLDPVDVFKVDSIQGVCIGEGEYTFPALLEKIDSQEPVSGIPGFYWRIDGGLIRQNPIPPIEPDLSRLPFPDYSIFEIGKINKYNSGWMPMMISRGCPHNCSYCCNHAVRSVYPNPKDHLRFLPVEYAIKMIKNSLSKYPGIQGIEFWDDNLTLDKRWFEEFSSLYEREIKLPFICYSRAEYVTEDVCSALKKSGCVLVKIGVESGNEQFRRSLLNRSVTNNQIVKAFKLLKDFGIQRLSLSILGFPFETKELMEETLSLNKRLKPDIGIVFYFFPFPKTELHSVCRRYNLLIESSKRLTNFLEQPSIKLLYYKPEECIKVNYRIRTYFLSRIITKNLTFFPEFISEVLYCLLNIYPFSLFCRFLMNSPISRKTGLKSYYSQSMAVNRKRDIKKLSQEDVLVNEPVNL